MQEFIENIQLPLLFLTSGSLLLTSDLIVFISFLKNKELRTGIYGTVLASIISELCVAVHSILFGLLNLFKIKVDGNLCIAESFLSVFFSLFWVCENTSIMLLFLFRKIGKSNLCNYLHIFSFVFSLSISLYLFFNKCLGLSVINTCFIKEGSDESLFFIACCFYFLFFLSILYNIWFFKYRDTNRDRSFLNGYNYFMLFSSFLNAFYFFNLVIDFFIDDNFDILNMICVIFLSISSVYTAIFRIKIEYINLFFCDEDGNNKYKNILKFIICKYTLPKFKDVKKRLNVKFIDTDPQKDELIYTHMINNNDVSFS